jgi:hypothetical protein
LSTGFISVVINNGGIGDLKQPRFNDFLCFDRSEVVIDFYQNILA